MKGHDGLCPSPNPQLIKKENCTYCKIIEDTKQHYQDNSEQIIIKAKQYNQDNKEQIRIKKKRKITCVCGCEIRKDSLSSHLKTPKPLSLVQNLK